MVEKRLYLFKDGELWFNDFVLVIEGSDFRQKNLHYVHLGDKTTTVGHSAFEGNYLTQIHFHKKIKWIESRAFANNKIEKIIFSRLEVPQIEKDAFVGNPISTIIVPYETIDAYKEMLSKLEFDREVNIVSNIEIKFNKLNAVDKESSIILIIAKPIYGDYTWRVEKEEITDFETLMSKDFNKLDFRTLQIKGQEYHIFKDSNHNVILYKKEGNQYFDMTYQDFEIIYNEAREDIL